MATVTLSSALVASEPWGDSKRTFLIKNRVTVPVAQRVANDYYQALPVKAGWFVHQVMVKIIQAATGTTETANVGDGDAAAGWDAAINLKAAAGTVTCGAPGTDANLTAGGKHYANDDTIDLQWATITAGAGTFIADVFAVVTDLNG